MIFEDVTELGNGFDALAFHGLYARLLRRLASRLECQTRPAHALNECYQRHQRNHPSRRNAPINRRKFQPDNNPRRNRRSNRHNKHRRRISRNKSNAGDVSEVSILVKFIITLEGNNEWCCRKIIICSGI